MALLAGQTALWLGLGLAGGFLFVLTLLPLLALTLVVFDGDADDVADVQRFIALTEEARSLVPAGLPLFDGEKATATRAALVRFHEQEDEAPAAPSGRRETGVRRSRAQRPGEGASSELKVAVADPAIRRRARSGREAHLRVLPPKSASRARTPSCPHLRVLGGVTQRGAVLSLG